MCRCYKGSREKKTAFQQVKHCKFPYVSQSAEKNSGGWLREFFVNRSFVRENTMDQTEITRLYAARTLHQLDLLRTDYKWVDVILRSEGEMGVEFPAHRCVLASASPYFNVMLGGGPFLETEKRTIILRDVSDEGIRLFLEFVYSGEVKLSAEKVEDALRIATLTQVDELITACEDFLLESLDKNNVVDIWTHTVAFSLQNLQSRILGYVGRHLLSIDQKVLLRFDGDFIQRLLRDTVVSAVENSILGVIIAWLQFNYKCREKYAKRFLGCIYWDRIHLRDTRAVASKCVKPLRQMVIEASKNPSPPVPRGMQQGIVLFGGFSIDGAMNEVRFLSVGRKGQLENQWKTVTQLPMKYRTVDFGTCSLPDGGFLVCGGVFLDENMVECRCSAVYIYDAHSGRWIWASPMKKSRAGCVAVWFRNFVYVFGGDDGLSATYERYNICSNTWEFLGSCPVASEGAAVCVIKNKILLSGGLLDTDVPSDHFWSYEPENSFWSHLPPLPTSCSDHAMFYCGKLYSVGGWTARNGQHILLNQAFSFSADSGWTQENWTVPKDKAFQQFTVIDRWLCVVGGGSLKASERISPKPDGPTNESGHTGMDVMDLVTKTWQKVSLVGIASSFWDHKTTFAFLPRLLSS